MDYVLFNQLILAFAIIIPIVLIARTVVAGTRYSPILIIVVFGLLMGHIMVYTGIATKGLPEFPILLLMSRVTLIALIVSFFIGGQELHRLIIAKNIKPEGLFAPNEEEVIMGTKRTQLFFIVRSMFILLGIYGLFSMLTGTHDDPLKQFYPILAYIGIVLSIIFLDNRAKIENKRLYIKKGVLEIFVVFLIFLVSHHVVLFVSPVIRLPQIFFAMIISCVLGFMTPKWQSGPTVRAMLFAGIPVVLAANFLVGGSRIVESLKMTEMWPVISYGFFGQIFWMFSGIALIVFLGRKNHVRNIAPGMAGSLSHAGLTGACTAGDLGEDAAARAPIMINIPFSAHIIMFPILAYSVTSGKLTVTPALILASIGIVATVLSMIKLRKATTESEEVKSLMLFSFGWQLTAFFGSFLLLFVSGININNSAVAVSSALSHFGLFAAIQGGMFGNTAETLIPFIFAMPFLVHPIVFGLFGKAMANNGKMPEKVVAVLAITGLVGVLISLAYF